MFLLVVLEALITTLFLPESLKRIVDVAEKTVSSRELLSYLVLPIGIFLLLQIVMEIFIRLRDYLFLIKTVPAVRKKVVKSSTQVLLKKDYAFYQRKSPGYLSENLMRLSSAVPDLVDVFLMDIISFMLVFLFAVYAFMCIDVVLGSFFIVFFIFTHSVLVFFTPKLSERSNRSFKKRSIVAGRIWDMLLNILPIKLFTSKRMEVKALDRRLDGWVKAEQKVEWGYLTMFFTLGVAYFTLQGGSLYLLLKRAEYNQANLGDIIKVLYINETLITAIWYDLPDLNLWAKSIGSIQQALGMLKVFPEKEVGKVQDRLVCKQGKIAFRNVTFAFPGSREPLFKNLTLDIFPGQKVGIVGASGSGKSTLVNLLLRLYDVDNGDIFIDDQNIRSVTKSSVHASISIVPQNTTLFNRSLLENIQYGNPTADEAAVREAAKQAYAHDFIVDMPNGYATMVGPDAVTLSGGQTKRISIARALLKDAPILILDEANAYLDTIVEHKLHHSLNRLMAGKTTIFISHRLDVLVDMDTILVFDQGRLVEHGPHALLVKQNGVYARLWTTQSEGLASLKRQTSEAS